MTESFQYDGYRAGAVSRIIGLHMDYYADTWSFGAPFESKLARELGAFLARYDPDRDLFLNAYSPRSDLGGDLGSDLVGSITIDGLEGYGAGAHLRWFIVSDKARGSGLGGQLMARAMDFVDARNYRQTYLTTFKGLDAARSLYERHDFTLTQEEAADPWSGTVGLQRFDRVRM